MIKARRHGATTIPPAWLILAALAAAGCAGSERTTPAVLTTPSASLPAHARATQSAGAAMLFGEVQRELAAMRVTHYRHTTRVDEASATFFYDCSGLLDYAIGRARPADANALPTSTTARPLAGDIEGYLHRGLSRPIQGWQALTRVDELGAGDVIAWQATEDFTTGDTGHVMIVLGAPTRNPARPGEWLVRVADSTLNPHASDSRHPGTTGLGTGTIGLVVDDGDAPTAFYWRGGLSKQAKPTEIALGRPL
jgi:hypothetical protein